jgi:predicted transposase/invertase (TIGR01784 family)
MKKFMKNTNRNTNTDIQISNETNKHTYTNVENNKIKQKLVTDKIEYHIIDLKRFKQKKGAKGELADWINLILGKEDQIKMAEKKNKELKKANEQVKRMSQDEEAKELYRLIQKGRIEENTRISNAIEKGMIKGRAEGEAIGEQRGEARGKAIGAQNKQIEIAKKLLERGENLEDIVDITGLTKEEIEALNKE